MVKEIEEGKSNIRIIIILERKDRKTWLEENYQYIVLKKFLELKELYCQMKEHFEWK